MTGKKKGAKTSTKSTAKKSAKVSAKSAKVKKSAKKNPAKKKKQIKKKVAAIPASDELPELPPLDNELASDFDFENVPSATAEPETELLPVTSSQEEVTAKEKELGLELEKKQKTPWYKKLFSKKKTTEELHEELQSAFKEDIEDYEEAKEEPPERREQVYLENMKRRMDQEIRERHSHLDSKHKEIEEREKDVSEKEQELVKREFEAVKKEKEVQEILDLKEQVEDLKVSLEYQKQRIEELKSELAIKDSELREREIELDEREEKLKELEHVQEHEQELIAENTQLKTEVDEEDDAIEYLERELERQRKEFEEKMLALNAESIKTPDAIETIHQLITECYVELSQGNTRNVRATYNKIREVYTLEGRAHDKNKAVHKEILRLYDDIRKQN